MITVEEFRSEVRQWLADNLVGDYAALKGLGGPGREHEAFEERLAWNRHADLSIDGQQCQTREVGVDRPGYCGR